MLYIRKQELQHLLKKMKKDGRIPVKDSVISKVDNLSNNTWIILPSGWKDKLIRKLHDGVSK